MTHWTAGSSSPTALIRQIGMDLHLALGCAATAIAINDDAGHRRVVYQVGYPRTVLAYLLSEFITSDPAYPLLASAMGDVLTWDDVPTFRGGAAASQLFRTAGFQQGSTVPFANSHREIIGEIHLNFAAPSAPKGARSLVADAARCVEPIAAALTASEAVRLTKRQLELLSLVAEGCTNREIGQILNISHRTVDIHVRRACETLQVHSRGHAVIRAVRLGLLELHPGVNMAERHRPVPVD